MKKIFASILCVMLLIAFPVVAFADGDSTGVVETEGVVEDNSTTTEEIVTEGENSAPEAAPEETLPTFEEEVDMVTEQIVAWLTANAEEISVVITLVGYGIVLFTRLRRLIKSTGTINNNAIAITEASNKAIDKALSNMENASGVVSGYDTRITAMLEAFKTTAEDKQRLEAELIEIKEYLKTSSKSNIEFADELSELLGLANIPVYKKQELGERHVAAKKAIIDAEAKAEATVISMMPTTTEEVKEDVGEEA